MSCARRNIRRSTAHTYLDYTAGESLRDVADRRGTSRCCGEQSARQPALDQPRLRSSRRSSWRGRGGPCCAFFNASPDEWEVVFTGNASQALKLVGESYPFGRGDRFLLTFDNHNSVNGIREFARAAGRDGDVRPGRAAGDARRRSRPRREPRDRREPGGHNLFAYPAQSNFSGVQHPLEWIAQAQAKGWDVLLDAAAFTATNRLDLSRWKPDFVVQSFYKMFGYPTGVGCLLARKTALAKLRRPWFSGGTITVASVQGDKYYLAEGAVGVRGRHARLSRAAGRRDRPAAHRVDRHRHDPRARPLPDRLAARSAAAR